MRMDDQTGRHDEANSLLPQTNKLFPLHRQNHLMMFTKTIILL